MTEQYRFFDSANPLEPDRAYNAQEFTDYFKALVTTGVMKGTGNQLTVTTSGSNMISTIDTGIAFLIGRYYENDSLLALTHDTEAVGKNRIDRIVIRMDLSTGARYVKAFVKKGVASASPVIPPLVQTASLYEISLARILIVGGQTFIATNAVTDERGTDIICPWAGSKILPNFNEDALAEHVINEMLHKQSNGSIQTGLYSNAEGISTKAIGADSHAEGDRSEANGKSSHAEGIFSKAEGLASHTEGQGGLASGVASHAEGSYTVASGNMSHSAGEGTIASIRSSHASGRYNKAMAGSATSIVSTDDAYVIGNGTDVGNRGNAFRITFDGKVYGLSAFNSTGADYAEYFEWQDGNEDNEDRSGFFVTMDGEYIRKSTSQDDFIVGVVSVNPSVVGDSHQDDWSNKYVKDEWGRIQYEWVGEDYIPVYNPNWDSTEEYIPREKRKEWSPIGIVGKLLVRDDGSCIVNGYCKTNDDGIATKSEIGYRVMKRVSENIIQIFIK